MEINKYIEHLAEYTAEALLDHMRPMVEKILQNHAVLQPPSMSVRALYLINKLDNSNFKGKKIEDVAPLLHERKALRDFLAVHRTVSILDGKP